MCVQEGDLFFQALWQRDIISVHPCHKYALSLSKGLIQRSSQSEVRFVCNDFDSWIILRRLC
jgi:hypothetical protein